MQGSFEKKVQSTLDELRLEPSAPLWEKIEEQLKPEKKRRRGLFWLPLGLLLLAGGWWIWSVNEKDDAVLRTVPAETTISTETKRTMAPSTPSANTSNGAEQPNKTVNPQPQQPLTPMASKKPVAEKTKARSTTNPTRNAGLHSTATLRNRNRSAAAGLLQPSASKPKQAGVDKNELIRAEIKKDIAPKSTATLLAEKAPDLAIKENTSAGKNEPQLAGDSALKARQTAAEKKPEPAIKDSVAAKKKIAAAFKKWKLTVTGQAGWSGSSSVQPSAYSDTYSSPTQSNGGTGLNSAVGRPNALGRHAVYSIGLGLTRAIGEKLQLTTALQYSVYRSRTKVGTYRPLDTSLFFRSYDVSVGGYYTNGQQQDYNIRHRVLELPVSIGYRLLPKQPLYVTAGAQYGYLLKSNALTYNSAGNFYYENNENLSRHQVALLASLQYGIIYKKAFTFSAGPMVQYQLTSFQKEAVPAQPKLFFAGLKTSLNF